MLDIATPLGTFSFSNITTTPYKPATIGRLRFGYQETEKEEKQYNLLYKGNTFSIDNLAIFQEIEDFKNRYPSRNLDLSLILKLLYPPTAGTTVDLIA